MKMRQKTRLQDQHTSTDPESLPLELKSLSLVPSSPKMLETTLTADGGDNVPGNQREGCNFITPEKVS